jgi:hypothetical protein
LARIEGGERDKECIHNFGRETSQKTPIWKTEEEMEEQRIRDVIFSGQKWKFVGRSSHGLLLER